MFHFFQPVGTKIPILFVQYYCFTYVQKCMQWRNWRKIASRWRFELDAKSGPLEAGDFGENGDPCMQWRKWRKITSLWRFELDAKSGPLEAGNFGEIGDSGKNMWQNIQIGCPEMAAMAKMAKLVKNRQPLAI